MARQKLPDLIVTDLTMPGIDGFGLVEELKLDPRTKDIPIVVVSAKDITAEERKRLNGHIEAVYQKGSLPPRKFVDQVIHVIEDKKWSLEERHIMGNNILYIEDNPDNMMLVKRALEARGYRLLEAENGLDGVTMAENRGCGSDPAGHQPAGHRRVRSGAPAAHQLEDQPWPTCRSSPSPPTP